MSSISTIGLNFVVNTGPVSFNRTDSDFKFVLKNPSFSFTPKDEEFQFKQECRQKQQQVDFMEDYVDILAGMDLLEGCLVVLNADGPFKA
jgi:hypothetical protein